jgi:low temperature requirement protein LtrA
VTDESPLSRLVERLGLRAPARPPQEAERHATWLELFFDLVFVLALAAVAGRLGPHATPRTPDAAITFGLFALVQWAWVGQVFYDTRYDPDDAPHRLMVLAAMAGAAAIAAGVGDAPDTLLLPVGYLVVRGSLLVQYLRARASSRSARELTTVYFTGFGLAWLMWLASLAAPAHIRPAIWITAFGIELITPWLGIRRLARIPADTSHLPERIGQFTIILLGVSLTDMLAALRDHPPPRAITAALAAFVMPASIWWIYTTFVTTRLALPRLRGGQAYAYLHLPFGAALLFLGWSLGQIVRLAASGAPALPLTLRLLLAAAIITWILSGLALGWVSLRSLSRRRLAAALPCIALVAVIVATVTRPVILLILLAATLASYAIITNYHIRTAASSVQEQRR